MGIDLVTLQEYKTYQGISSPNQDAQISSIITKASQLVKTYCKRNFVDYVDEQKVEVFQGGSSLLLQESPVINILSVEVSTDYGKTYTELAEYTDWILDRYVDQVVPTTSFGYLPNGYRVTYTAGYEEVPGDLKLATMDLVTYYMKNDGAIHSTKGPGSNSVQIEYISTTNLPAHIKRILDLYVTLYL
jgi:Phage gp6-like head-tail connector protein